MADSNLTALRLRQLIRYDGEDGSFFRIVALKGGRVGVVNLSASGNGYTYISIDGCRYLAHRIAWLYVYGIWPVNDIDHINCVRTDNRIANLRDVERHVNNQNRAGARSDNKSSGMTGVSWHVHSKKWRVRIWLKGKEYRVGLFDSPEDAHEAYVKQKRILHEGCTI